MSDPEALARWPRDRENSVNGRDVDGKNGDSGRICPRCGSTKVVPIVYGKPTAEADEEAERGEIVLGGCCFSTKFPDRHCHDCQHEWRQADGAGLKP